MMAPTDETYEWAADAVRRAMTTVRGRAERRAANDPKVAEGMEIACWHIERMLLGHQPNGCVVGAFDKRERDIK